MSFNLGEATVLRFTEIDQVWNFVVNEEEKLFRLPAKGFWKEGARFIDDQYLGKPEYKFRFNEYSFNNLCNLIGTTPWFLQSLRSSDLTSQVLNDALASAITKGKLETLEFICDEETKQIVGIVSEKFVGYSNNEFLRDIFQALDPIHNTDTLFPTLIKYKFHEAYSINTRLFLRIECNNVQGIVRGRGGQSEDISTIGLQISNSMAGGHAVRLAYFIHRLICANGLVAQVAGNQGRVAHVGSRDTFLKKIKDGSNSVLGSLKTAKQLIENLGGIEFDANQLARFSEKKDIFSIIPDRDLEHECRNRLRGEDYSQISSKTEIALRKVADQINQIPICLGGPEALAVFQSYWRDNPSMYDFINVFTEYAKRIKPAERLQVEENAGNLANWIVANKRRFKSTVSNKK